MLTDILEIFNIMVSSTWLAAVFNSAGAILLFFLFQFVLKKLAHHWQKIEEGRKTSYFLKSFLKLLRRLSYVLLIYSVANTLPVHKKYELFLQSFSFILGVTFVLFSAFEITDATT